MSFFKFNTKKQLFFFIADFIIVSIVLLKLSYIYINKSHHKKKSTVLVETEYASIRPMPYLLGAPGNIEAKNTVAITPQVTAIIKQIHFCEGEQVKQGQLLFELDPSSFLENILQAKANLAKDQATLLQNEADAKRLTELAKLDYVTRQQKEQAVTIVEAQKGVVAADLAQLHQA